MISLSDFRGLSHQLVPCGDTSPGIAGKSAWAASLQPPPSSSCEEPMQVTSPPPPCPCVSVGVSAAPPAQVCSHNETWRAWRPCTPWQVGSAGDAGLSVAAARAPVPHLPVMSPKCRKHWRSTCSAPVLRRCSASAEGGHVTSALAGRADNGLLYT